MGARIRSLIAVVMLAACGRNASVDKTPLADAKPVDILVVPGCPTRDDGSLSVCQRRRIQWGAWLWHAGLAKGFIVSGSNVVNRYFEADSLAAGLEVLGVPAEVITLELFALHTDENMYYAHLLAEEMGVESLAVATDNLQARAACEMVKSFGRPQCEVWAIHHDAIGSDEADEHLGRVRTTPEPADTWTTRREREIARAHAVGRRPRPPSWLLYGVGAIRPGGWDPIPPPHTTVVRWSSRRDLMLVHP